MKQGGGVKPARSLRFQGFTLAEVLITIGIVGVVAALTIPNLMHSIRTKVLETQFNHSIAIVNQAIRRAKATSEIDTFQKYCTAYDENNGEYYNFNECLDVLFDTLKYKGKKTNLGDSRYLRYDTKRYGKIKTYNGKQVIDGGSAMSGRGQALMETNTMPNGSYLNFFVNGYEFYIGIDINGSAPPNRFGHDAFLLVLSSSDTLTGTTTSQVTYTDEQLDKINFSSTPYREMYGDPCNLTSNQKANGIGCGYYVLKNKCPYDNTKTYWECLP